MAFQTSSYWLLQICSCSKKLHHKIQKLQLWKDKVSRKAGLRNPVFLRVLSDCTEPIHHLKNSCENVQCRTGSALNMKRLSLKAECREIWRATVSPSGGRSHTEPAFILQPPTEKAQRLTFKSLKQPKSIPAHTCTSSRSASSWRNSCVWRNSRAGDIHHCQQQLDAARSYFWLLPDR